MTAKESADPLLFLGGPDRSGTTLLRNMLDAHPAVAVPDESYFVTSVLARVIHEGREADPLYAWQLISADRYFRSWALPPARVEEQLRADPPLSYADLLRSIFTAYAIWRGRPLCADKTPRNCLYFELLAQMFPTSRFVYLVRDPRAVCMSAVVQPWATGGLAQAARMWKERVAAARRAALSLPDRVIEIRYEALISDPKTQLERLCAFGGLEYSEDMLTYPRSPLLPKDSHHWRSQTPVGRDERLWWREMSSSQLRLVESMVGELMEEAGYVRQTKGRGLCDAAVIACDGFSRILDWRLRHRWELPPFPLPRHRASAFAVSGHPQTELGGGGREGREG